MVANGGSKSSGVFINCPFDAAFNSLLRPLLFTILYVGYRPRLASERSDSGELRLQKICKLIESCEVSIHDLSRLRAQEEGELYRLNMAFELGLEYGFRTFSTQGGGRKLLVLETGRYEFMKALSDLSGVDIKNHDDDPALLVRRVRNWFIETVGLKRLPSSTKIWYDFNDFMAEFYERRQEEGFEEEDLHMMPVPELLDFMEEWIKEG